LRPQVSGLTCVSCKRYYSFSFPNADLFGQRHTRALIRPSFVSVSHRVLPLPLPPLPLPPVPACAHRVADTACQVAVKAMVRWINETKAIGLYEAYMLCSCAGDLKISGTVPHSRTLVSIMASDRNSIAQNGVRSARVAPAACCLRVVLCVVCCGVCGDIIRDCRPA
jgi:hypothetical protein